MKTKNRIWNAIQEQYVALIHAYFIILEELNDPAWHAKHKMQYSKLLDNLSATVYKTINETQIQVDWSFADYKINKRELRHMERLYLGDKFYHLRIGAYPTN